MNNKTKLEQLQYDCILKAKNVRAAVETALNKEFDDDWVIENYLSCLTESEESVKKLVAYLEYEFTPLSTIKAC